MMEKNFNEIAKIKGAGNSTVINQYQYTDGHPLNGISYYRLRQVDFDGKISYSDIIINQFSGSDEISIFAFPDPATDILNVLCTGRSDTYNIQIIRADGICVKTIQMLSAQIKIDIGDLDPGLYFLKVFSDNENKSLRFLKE